LDSPNSVVTCKDFLRELNDYLDETADPALRAELERHVCECPNCWVVCDTTRKTIQVYKGMEPQALPQSVHARLMAMIAKKKKTAPESH
jgi:anti-sigma factor RsiW